MCFEPYGQRRGIQTKERLLTKESKPCSLSFKAVYSLIVMVVVISLNANISHDKADFCIVLALMEFL